MEYIYLSISETGNTDRVKLIVLQEFQVDTTPYTILKKGKPPTYYKVAYVGGIKNK